MSEPRRIGLLAGLFVVSECLYVTLMRLRATNGARPVALFLATMAALFAVYALAYAVVRWSRAECLLVAAGAVLFRLTLVPAGLPHDATLAELRDDLVADVRGDRVTYERFLLYDSDVWRYLWDGHAWAHGVNPFAYPPSSEAVDRLADIDDAGATDGRDVWADVRDNINYPTVPTIYPPLAQAVFRAAHRVAPGSVVALKLALVGFDLATAWLVAALLAALGRPRRDALLYAWNPLVIKTIAGSAHVDVVAACALAAAAYLLVTRRRTAAAVALGLAILGKLTPIVLLPFLGRRVGWRRTLLTCAVVAAGYAPFLGAGARVLAGLRTFAASWQFNAGPFALTQWLLGLVVREPSPVARLLCTGAFAIAVLLMLRRGDARPESFAREATWALGAALVLSATVMPWYLVWLLPLAIAAGEYPWVLLSALVCAAFLVMVDGTERPWALILEYGGFAVAVIWHRMANRARVSSMKAPALAAGL